MAIDEEASLWPTESLLLKEGRKHYYTNVSPIHWQLRSLVSAEQQDIVYFPAGANNTHITRLHTTTRECETIRVINFPPRCLVASEGWICCGGESGEFTVIRDVGRTDAQDDVLGNEFRSTLSSLESSSVAEGSMSRLHRDMLNLVERINGSNKTWSSSNHKVGSERVNCITIWHPPQGKRDPAQYSSSPLAILANNDRTVTIVGLHDPGKRLDRLQYPDCVNRSVLSPDGTLLIAICDDPFLYVDVRRPVTKHQGDSSEKFEWVLLPRIRLKGQWYEDATDCRGSFAACFSPSGRYLAVGTQYGTISVFDANALKDPDSDALVAYFNSDRSPGEFGAVRDMAFSPGPFDLLAWTEHRGRVGIADVRTGFRQRQIVSLDKPEGFDHFALSDRSTADPRLPDPRNERDSEDSLRSLFLQNTMNQSISIQTPPITGALDFTPRVNISSAELAAAARDARRRELRERVEQRDQHLAESQGQQPAGEGSAAWRSPGWEHRETVTRILERERILGNREPHRSGSSQAQPEQDRERRAPTPRRRSSLMQAAAQGVDPAPQAIGNRAQGYGHDNPATSRGEWTPLYMGRLASGWRDIEALATISRGDDTIFDTARVESSRSRRGSPVITTGVWTSDRSFIRRARMGHREHPQNADDTAGLSWSEDGRILYVGAEDGIYEFHVNVQNRKTFPDIVPR
ncbi:hypothetical protein GGS23DRAFT_594639 [Durotheca rogersii]|uniref:uncharacterized protein n=1 Tax=Durotheca rogersii TaxID=419775 RepID=UPI002220F0A4|nr:uncharacterized protein GGS23DRAFT_594639 [Durotheca rogersii]KAI5865085.1 hypothetical protein GGS23DRAFT_594639 [Durotheca rogersii]